MVTAAIRTRSPGRPPEFSWTWAATVAHAIMQTGSLRGAERTLRPARSTIRAWRESHRAFALLVAIAQEVRPLMRKAKEAKRAGYAENVWGAYDDEWRDHCRTAFHVLYRVAEVGPREALSPEFDAEMTEYLKREAKRLGVKP